MASNKPCSGKKGAISPCEDTQGVAGQSSEYQKLLELAEQNATSIKAQSDKNVTV